MGGVSSVCDKSAHDRHFRKNSGSRNRSESPNDRRPYTPAVGLLRVEDFKPIYGGQLLQLHKREWEYHIQSGQSRRVGVHGMFEVKMVRGIAVVVQMETEDLKQILPPVAYPPSEADECVFLQLVSLRNCSPETSPRAVEGETDELPSPGGALRKMTDNDRQTRIQRNVDTEEQELARHRGMAVHHLHRESIEVDSPPGTFGQSAWRKEDESTTQSSCDEIESPSKKVEQTQATQSSGKSDHSSHEWFWPWKWFKRNDSFPERTIPPSFTEVLERSFHEDLGESETVRRILMARDAASNKTSLIGDFQNAKSSSRLTGRSHELQHPVSLTSDKAGTDEESEEAALFSSDEEDPQLSGIKTPRLGEEHQPQESEPSASSTEGSESSDSDDSEEYVTAKAPPKELAYVRNPTERLMQNPRAAAILKERTGNPYRLRSNWARHMSNENQSSISSTESSSSSAPSSTLQTGTAVSSTNTERATTSKTYTTTLTTSEDQSSSFPLKTTTNDLTTSLNDSDEESEEGLTEQTETDGNEEDEERNLLPPLPKKKGKVTQRLLPSVVPDKVSASSDHKSIMQAAGSPTQYQPPLRTPVPRGVNYPTSSSYSKKVEVGSKTATKKAKNLGVTAQQESCSSPKTIAVVPTTRSKSSVTSSKKRAAGTASRSIKK